MQQMSRRELLSVTAALLACSCHRGPRMMMTTLGVSGML
jgi:RNase P/RNase MRP subunit POP5